MLGLLLMTFLDLFLLTNDYSNFELRFPTSWHGWRFLVSFDRMLDIINVNLMRAIVFL